MGANDSAWRNPEAEILHLGRAEPVPPAEQRDNLDRALQLYLGRTRGRIVERTGHGIVVERPAQVNHVLHALLSLLTFGLWLFAWLLVVISSHPRRFLVTVDACGAVHANPL